MGFRNLFKKTRKTTNPAAPLKLTVGIRDSILTTVGTRSIPTMPGAAQRAFQLSTDPRAEVRDFVSVIESDEALSARVLKIANSVYFDRGQSSSTIDECVTLIGLNEIKSLLNATTLSEIFPSKHPARASLWAHDIAVAITAKILANQYLPGQEEIAFLGGLMHDIGKLLLLQRAADAYNSVLSTVATSGCSFCEAEEQQFVFNHTEVGQLIAERWNFSPELTSVIRSHHDPLPNQGIPSPPPTLGQIIGFANTIAHALALGHGHGLAQLQNNSEESLPLIWNSLGVPPEQQRAVLQNIRRTYELEYNLYAGKGLGSRP